MRTQRTQWSGGRTLQSEVKCWYNEKKFGFIKNGQGPDIFVHASELKNCEFLKPGVKVQFTVFPDNNRLVAKEVSLVRLPRQNHQNQNNGQRYNQGQGNSQHSGNTSRYDHEQPRYNQNQGNSYPKHEQPHFVMT